MNRCEVFKAMNAKVIVLLKRDSNYKLKLVSNGKKGLSVRGNRNKTRFTSSTFSDPLQFAFSLLVTSLWFTFRSSLYFLLTLLFRRHWPFYLCLFFSFAFLTPYSDYFGVLSSFLSRFSRLALRLLLLAFFDRPFSFFPAYFHSKPYFYELEL